MQKNIKKTTKQDVQNSPIVQANYNVLGIEFVSKDDQPMVSSVQVAENFGKQHTDVLRAIKNLDVPEDFNRRNFAPVEYEDKKGEKRPAYLMTRDGFTLLVMGFTGPKAMEWKLRYIQAFNAMEQTILQQLQAKALESKQISSLIQRISDLERAIRIAVPGASDYHKMFGKDFIPPIKIFQYLPYEGSVVRFFIFRNQLCADATDIAHICGYQGDLRSQELSLEFLDKHFGILTFPGLFQTVSYSEIAKDYGIGESRLLEFFEEKRTSLYDINKDVLWLPGIFTLQKSEQGKKAWQWICETVFPEVPSMFFIYHSIQENMRRLREQGQEILYL